MCHAVLVNDEDVMLGGALQITTAAPDDVILVVVAALCCRNILRRTVNLVRGSGSRAARFPFDVLQGVGAVDDGHPGLPFDNILGDGVVDVTGLGVVEVVQFVGHLLQNLQERDCKVF